MILREVFEDITRQAYYGLRYLEKAAGRRAGWYLANEDDDGDTLPDFYYPPASAPAEIMRIRAREHARHLGLRVTKVPTDGSA